MRLITIPMSHYCEKARWGLAHAGLDYVEEAHLQIFHYRAVRPYNPQGMVPVLITEAEAISDSTAILQFLDRRLTGPRKLYPEKHREDVESLEDRFDEQLGVETRRWAYYNWMNAPKRQVLHTAAQGAPAWERALAPLLYPLMLRYLGRHLEISRENVEKGLQLVSSIFDEVAARISDGRPYLCGDHFTAADLGLASMAAPLLLPPEYGIRLPTPDQAPAQARSDIRQFREHPAGQFALRLFKDKRQGEQVS